MTAASTEAVEFKTVRGNDEAVSGGDFLLEFFDLAVFKLYDFPTVSTNQVVVMAFVGNVVVLRLGAEMPGLCQTGFAEEVEGAVDRREPQVRVFLCQLVVHLFCGDVLLLEKGFEDQLPLARILQLMLAEVRFQRLHRFHMFRHRVPPSFLLRRPLKTNCGVGSRGGMNGRRFDDAHAGCL